MKLEGTEKDRSATGWSCWFKRVGGHFRTRRRQTEWQHRDVMRRRIIDSPQLTHSMLPRKASSGDNSPTVPQTDTGGWGEHPKALERTLVKELGKLTP